MSFSDFDNRTILRVVLGLIIVGTIPFYLLAALVAIGNSGSSAEPIVTPSATFTPLGAGNTDTPTPSPTSTRFVTNTPETFLSPTPIQFVPPPTRAITSTPLVIVTDTPAPTITPSTDTDSDGILDQNDACPFAAGPVSNNGCPLPTSTPPPTQTPIPSSTPIPPPTDTQAPPTKPPAEDIPGF